MDGGERRKREAYFLNFRIFSMDFDFFGVIIKATKL